MPGLLSRPLTVLQHTGELGVVDVDVDVDSARHSVYSDSVIYWLLSPTGCSPTKSPVASTALSSSVGKTWSGVVECRTSVCSLQTDCVMRNEVTQFLAWRGNAPSSWSRSPGRPRWRRSSRPRGDWLVSSGSGDQSVVDELGDGDVEVTSYRTTRET